jgi:hypothetical protein
MAEAFAVCFKYRDMAGKTAQVSCIVPVTPGRDIFAVARDYFVNPPFPAMRRLISATAVEARVQVMPFAAAQMKAAAAKLRKAANDKARRQRNKLAAHKLAA